MVREHVDTAQPATTLVVDNRACAYPDASGLDEACELAASVVATVQARGRQVSLHALDDDPRRAAALGARGRLDRLAALEAVPQTDPAALLEIAERAPAGGALVVVTGEVDASALVALSQLRRRFAPVVLVQLVPGAAARAERAAGVTVVRAATAANAAAAWRALLRGGRA